MSDVKKPLSSSRGFEPATVEMGEVSYAPLSSACVRALTDKMYDKRKAAALEIEK